MQMIYSGMIVISCLIAHIRGLLFCLVKGVYLIKCAFIHNIYHIQEGKCILCFWETTYENNIQIRLTHTRKIEKRNGLIRTVLKFFEPLPRLLNR